MVVLHSISYLLALEGLLMVLCGVASGWVLADPATAWQPLLGCGGGILLLAGVLWISTPTRRKITRRDGIAIVAIGWIVACLLGALPFILSGVVPTFSAAFFESSSGLTTTGSTVIPCLETVPRGILLWRATSHLLGGLGVLVLLVAILPLAGAGGSQIVRAEAPSSSGDDRVEPRMTSTAKALWGTYLGLCAVLLILLRSAGMGWFDATCHAFSAIATGGFSTRTASVGAYASPAIEAILAVFMILSALNFALHYRAFRGEGFPHFRSADVRFYLGTLVVSLAAIVAALRCLSPAYAGATLLHTVRDAAFTVASLATTTGFCTADYGAWPALAKYILLILFLVGGTAGSTSGGIKSGRIMVLFRAIWAQIRLFLQPAAVLPVRHGRKVLPPAQLLSVAGFVLLFGATIALSTLVLLPACPDFAVAASAAAATVSNTGPGFAAVGPAFSYAALPPPALAFLGFLMILGRLEILTVLALLLPSFWRR